MHKPTNSLQHGKRAIRTAISPTIIAISGVPGTGKSKVARLLSKQLGTESISITELVKAGKIPHTWDRIRKTAIVDVKDVQRAIDKIIAQSATIHNIIRSSKSEKRTIHNITSPSQSEKRAIRTFIVEGLLAHLIRANVIFVLRCNPTVLRKRLKSRRWPKKKVEENVQAEMLDVISSEALDKNTYEIDTTHKTPKQTTDVILRALKSAKYAKKLKPGKINWLKTSI